VTVLASPDAERADSHVLTGFLLAGILDQEL
jgi:hypothetical protein